MRRFRPPWRHAPPRRHRRPPSPAGLRRIGALGLVAALLGAGALASCGGATAPARTVPAAGPLPVADVTVLGASGVGVRPTGPRLPSGWTVDPAGRQVVVAAQPDGVAVSPDGQTVFVPTSGQWHETLTVIGARTLAAHAVPDASAFLGVDAVPGGAVWVSGGGRDQLLPFRPGPGGSVTAPGDFAGAIPPLAPSTGLGVRAPGYPGNLVSGPGGWVYAAGTLPVSAASIHAADPSAGTCPGGGDVLGAPAGGSASAAPPTCSVVDAVRVGTDVAASEPGAALHLIPVGQDAYGIAIDHAGSTLYVSNWADGAEPARGGGHGAFDPGDGTVSVVHLSAPGRGREIQAVRVGLEPMGIALSPDGRTLAVADAMSDTVSLLAIGGDGRVTAVRTVPVGLGPGLPGGAQPVAVAYTPDGRLLVALFGLDAVEVLSAAGRPIPEPLGVSGVAPQSPRRGGEGPPVRTTRWVTVPWTFIPTGWMPWAMATGPEPSGAGRPGDERLYVANYQGMGASAGMYFPGSDFVGASGTEGSVSVVDLPGPGPSGRGALQSWTAETVAADDLVALVDPHGVTSAATDPCAPVALGAGEEVSSPLLCAISAGTVDPRTLHVVLVLRESKTVDSMLGYLHASLPALDASPSDETYGASDTPNLARLASQFGVDDNNWVAGDESETGRTVLASGETTPYIELFVHVGIDAGYRGERTGDPLAAIDDTPHRLEDEMDVDGVNERTFGGALNPNSQALAHDVPAAVWGDGPSPAFAGANTDFPDTERVGILVHGSATDRAWDSLVDPKRPPPEFGRSFGLCGAPGGTCDYPGAARTDAEYWSLADWTAAYHRCRASGGDDALCQQTMPQFVDLELPDDHTDVFNSANNPVMWAPQVMVANNDLATGQLVQALSETPFWRTTLVLVVEGDTQFTADHVNALRSYVVTAGGLAARLGPAGRVSHQVSSFCGVDKTIEDLFTMAPMEVCDATAFPLDSLLAARVPTGAVPGYTAVTPATPAFLGYPPAPDRLTPWCAKGKPTGIGHDGLEHYQGLECLASQVGDFAFTIGHGE